MKLPLKYRLIRSLSSVPFPPKALNLDITDNCNLNCSMCALHFIPDPYLDMTLEQFKSILNQFNSKVTPNITFAGMGEPTLNKSFNEMCSYAKMRGHNITVYSNSTNKIPEFIDQAIFNTEKINAINILRFKGKKTLNFVASKQNMHQLDEIKQYTQDLGYNLQITELRHMYPSIPLSQQYNDYIERNKIKVPEATEPTILRHRNCMEPWLATNISHNGWVTPCCIHQHPSFINFGNCLEQPFKKIWNNPKYKLLRKNLRSKNPPHPCLKCGI